MTLTPFRPYRVELLFIEFRVFLCWINSAFQQDFEAFIHVGGWLRKLYVSYRENFHFSFDAFTQKHMHT